MADIHSFTKTLAPVAMAAGGTEDSESTTLDKQTNALSVICELSAVTPNGETVDIIVATRRAGSFDGALKELTSSRVSGLNSAQVVTIDVVDAVLDEIVVRAVASGANFIATLQHRVLSDVAVTA